jgi:penicillin-binding protein 2
MGCLDKGVFDLRSAITVSDNTYFANVMQRVINNPRYPSSDSSLAVWDRYMSAFGLGHRLGVDVPSEKKGFIPTPAFYDKLYGKGKWNFCNFRSVSIGQGEVDVTPIQVANEMAYIANKGWYITPHLVDSIEGGDVYNLLGDFKTRHKALEIPDTIFEAIHDGMQAVVEHGTGVAAKIPGINVCGKTGTVENYFRGVKQPNHAFFCGFAPRENPTIAIRCVVENSGRFGGTYAAPIVGLLIEKYLRDTLAGKPRKDRVDQLSKLNLIPKRIFVEMRTQDSLRHAKDSAYLIAKGYIRQIRDTLDLDDDDENDALDRIKKDKDAHKKPSSNEKDTARNKTLIKTEAILSGNKKKTEKRDSIRP